MTAEGKLESEVDGKHSMTLRLKVDRHKLDGYERALIDGLFFNDAIVTSTKEVQRHYKDRGFNPAAVIRPELDKQVKRSTSGQCCGTSARDSAVRLRAWIAHFGRSVGPRLYRRHNWRHIRAGDFRRIPPRIPGWLFRSRIDWGMQAAALLMIPAFCISFAAAAFIWSVAGTGPFELPWTAIAGIAAWALWLSNSSISAMKSRQTAGAIAFRKRLAAGRRFL